MDWTFMKEWTTKVHCIFVNLGDVGAGCYVPARPPMCWRSEVRDTCEPWELLRCCC